MHTKAEDILATDACFREEGVESAVLAVLQHQVPWILRAGAEDPERADHVGVVKRAGQCGLGGEVVARRHRLRRGLVLVAFGSLDRLYRHLCHCCWIRHPDERTGKDLAVLAAPEKFAKLDPAGVDPHAVKHPGLDRGDRLDVVKVCPFDRRGVLLVEVGRCDDGLVAGGLVELGRCHLERGCRRQHRILPRNLVVIYG